jgi:hydrogenase maturation factor
MILETGVAEVVRLSKREIELGLGNKEETRKICEALGINDVNVKVVKNQDIIRAVKDHDGREMVEQMEKYQKCDELKKDDPTQTKNYL